MAFIHEVHCLLIVSSGHTGESDFIRGVKEICFYSKNWPGSVMGTGLIVLEKWGFNYPYSFGCWPSWAFHMHSVIFMSEKTAVKEDASGEQA